jgi:thiol-disulfide isomerase/thioredoxin
MTEPRSSDSSRWRTVLKWGERILWIVVLVFLAERLGPRVTAWTGIGPSFAPVESVAGASVPASTLDGAPLTLTPGEGQVQVVTFWATWCRVCRWELPYLQSLYDDMAAQGVEIMALSIDANGPPVVQSYRQEHDLTLPMGMAVAGSREVFGGIPGVPTTFIMDSEGRIRHRIVGASGPGTLRRAVERLLDAS